MNSGVLEVLYRSSSQWEQTVRTRGGWRANEYWEYSSHQREWCCRKFPTIITIFSQIGEAFVHWNEGSSTGNQRVADVRSCFRFWATNSYRTAKYVCSSCVPWRIWQKQWNCVWIDFVKQQTLSHQWEFCCRPFRNIGTKCLRYFNSSGGPCFWISWDVISNGFSCYQSQIHNKECSRGIPVRKQMRWLINL